MKYVIIIAIAVGIGIGFGIAVVYGVATGVPPTFR